MPPTAYPTLESRQILQRKFQKCESLNYPPVQELLFDNLGHIGSSHLRIPNAVGIDHHGGPDGAETNRSAFSKDDAAFRVLALRFFAKEYSARFQFTIKRFDYLGTTSRRAGHPSTRRRDGE